MERCSISRRNHPGEQRALTESGATRQIDEVEVSRRTQVAGTVHRQGGGASGPIASGRCQLIRPGGQNCRSGDDVTAMVARADLVLHAVHESHPVVAGQQLETEEMRSARQTGDGQPGDSSTAARSRASRGCRDRCRRLAWPLRRTAASAPNAAPSADVLSKRTLKN